MSLELWCPMGIERRAARRGANTAVARRTGLGPRRSQAFVRRLAADGRPQRADAVVLGLAGALSDAMAPGDVVVGDMVSGPGTDRYPAGPPAMLRNELQAAGIPAVCGPVLSVNRPAWGRRRSRAGGIGAVADMETWWLMAAQPKPLAVVRVVCDTPEAELMSLGLPWRVREALAVLARTVESLEAWAAKLGPRSDTGQA